MAITAKFVADFSDFYAQVEKANNKLDQMSEVALSVGEVIAGAFTGQMLANFAHKVLDAGDAIQKMSDQTGLSTDEVQKLDYIAGQTGSSIHSLINAVQTLEQKLGDENSGAAGAMAKLGISLADFGRLNPYQQMITLGDAIKDIKDPTEQASTAAAIFGKNWKELLPAIKAGMEDVGNQAPIMAASTVKALDEVGDALTRARAQAVTWGASLITGIEHVGFAFGDMLSVFNSEHLGTTNSRMLMLAGALNDPDGLKGALQSVKPVAAAVGTALGKVGMSAQDAASTARQLTGTTKDLIDVETKAAAAAKKAAEEHLRFADSVRSLTSNAIGAVRGFGMYGTLIADISDRSGKFREHMDDLTSSFNEFHGGITIAGDEMQTVTIPMFASLPNVVPQGTKALRDAASAAGSFGSSIKDALLGIPDMLQQAFLGGGGLSGGLKAIALKLGVEFGKDLSEGIKASVGTGGTGFNAVTGKAAAASGAVAGLGAALSGASAKAAVASVAMTGVAAAAGAIGVGATIGGAVALGAATAGIGLAAVGAYYAFKHFLNDTEKKINPIREQFVQLAGGLGTLNQRAHEAGITLDHLLSAKNPEQYQAAIDELNAAFKFQDDALSLLTATAQKYGFTLEELGPALQKQNLGKQAEEIYQDFQVLTAGGLDHVAVLTRMSDSVNTYVKNAAAMGIEVPSAMEPMLQQMIDLGLLTDKDGNKITDLQGAGVTFSTTLTQGFKSVVDAVQKLTEAIARGLGIALDNLPESVPDPFRDWNVPDLPEEPIRMARGGMGRVTKPTLFLAGESGPEDVAFSGGGKSFSDNSRDVSLNVTMNNVNDPETFAEQLRAAIRLNTRGIRTVINEAVA